MYTERPTTHSFVSQAINAVWVSEMKVNEKAFILPDGTSDIIIKANAAGAEIFLCGVMTKAAELHTVENKKYWGLRFNPGYSSLFLNFGEVNNQLVEINNLFTEKNHITDLMADPMGNSDLIEKLVLKQILGRNVENELRKKSRIVTEYSKIEFGEIDSFSQQLGISRRQFGRNFKNYFGYDPRYFTKMKKFNKFIDVAKSQSSKPLAELALECGFYDQSDLTHTVKEVSGLTPKMLMSQLYNT